MQAYIIQQFGSADIFETTEIAIPTVKPGHLLIRVLGTSVNPLDTRIRAGMMPGLVSQLPMILHGDVVGEVVEVGENVCQFKPGDVVYGYAGGLKDIPGALAEYMLVDAQLMSKKPSTLSIAQTAALALVALTAWDALFSKAKLQKGQSILIHGGVGGVGHIAVQLAKWAGAQVFATVRHSKDLELVESLGADHGIDISQTTTPDYIQKYTNGQGFDVVFDTIGKENLIHSFAAAAIGGQVVTSQARVDLNLAPIHEKALSFHGVFIGLPLLTGQGRQQQGENLQKISQLAEQGHLIPLIDPEVFSFEHIAAAHQKAESGQAKGKVVVVK